jgi:hypothetical protein
MPDGSDHQARVDAWLERSDGWTAEHLLQHFEATLGSLWRRARVTLGEVTLGAIVDRVLYNAAESYPAFSSLQVGPDGEIESRDLRDRVRSLHASEPRAGIRFVLIELLTVVGNLTAEILTPELHSELSRMGGLPEGEDENS